MAGEVATDEARRLLEEGEREQALLLLEPLLEQPSGPPVAVEGVAPPPAPDIAAPPPAEAAEETQSAGILGPQLPVAIGSASQQMPDHDVLLDVAPPAGWMMPDYDDIVDRPAPADRMIPDYDDLLDVPAPAARPMPEVDAPASMAEQPGSPELAAAFAVPDMHSGVPVVVVSPDELKGFGLDHVSGFLLSLMDGHTNVETLLDLCGLPRLQALRHLSDLMVRGVVRVETTRA